LLLRALQARAVDGTVSGVAAGLHLVIGTARMTEQAAATVAAAVAQSWDP
jgi:hypothetical protein